MSDSKIEKTQGTARPSSDTPLDQVVIGKHHAAKVTIDRYREALRKGVMLSQ